MRCYIAETIIFIKLSDVPDSVSLRKAEHTWFYFHIFMPADCTCTCQVFVCHVKLVFNCCSWYQAFRFLDIKYSNFRYEKIEFLISRNRIVCVKNPFLVIKNYTSLPFMILNALISWYQEFDFLIPRYTFLGIKHFQLIFCIKNSNFESPIFWARMDWTK
jgi:hypothetical protein